MATIKQPRQLALTLRKPIAVTERELTQVVRAITSILPNLGSVHVLVEAGEPDADAQQCSGHVCDGHEARPPHDPGGCPGLSDCDTEACSSHVCSSHDCDENGCGAHACSDDNFTCSSHTGVVLPASMKASPTWSKVLASITPLTGTWTSGVSATQSPSVRR